ncbi:hypothetical protein HDU82_002939 [Entophlyctis luteolus]|nr:hypothetical protein HDU82_002939 [Entophlyctis luteolus]
MGGYTLGLAAKAPAILKHRLASDLVLPMARHGDPAYTDASDEHRREMRNLLYGPQRLKPLIMHALLAAAASFSKDSNVLNSNYSDEKPPKWVSTFTVDYPMKEGDYDGVAEQAKEYYKLDPALDRKSLRVDDSSTIKELKSTHFSLGNDETSYMTSQYRSTFQKPQHEKEETKRRHMKETAKIFVDDSEVQIKSSTQHRDYSVPDALAVSKARMETQSMAQALKVTI